MRFLRWLVVAVAALVVAIVAVVVGARFADGPFGPFPGGAFQSGAWVENASVDWSFASEIQEIELESAGRSRITWLMVLDSEAYVPCSLDFPPGKSWHHEALDRPEAVVRIDAKRYRRRLLKVDDADLHQRLFEALGQKYNGGTGSGPDELWFFHLAAPTS